MNLRDLEYLVAVADHKHFNKAAQACFVSQPALSMQLQKLEDTLGVKLFERTNKKVLITPVGEDIAERARTILQEANEIKETALHYQKPLAGKYKIGAFPTLAPYLFPLIIPTLTKELPELKLLLVEEKTDILINKLKEGKIDAALLALPVADETLEYKQLFDDEFLLAVSKQHPLASKKEVSHSDLNNHNLMLLEEGHCLREQALDVCSLLGSQEQQDFRATSLETLRQMVAANIGITLIPKLARKSNDNITYIPFKQPPSRSIALFWRKSSARKECFKTIADKVKASIL